jgi:glycine/D-amino acid oxidase-like deaminating enzyme
MAVKLSAGSWEKLGIEPGVLYWDSRFFFLYFWVTPDGYLVFGGRAIGFEPFSTSLLPMLFANLIRNLHKTFPRLSIGQEVVSPYLWTGPIVVTPDNLPIVWRPSKNTKGTYGLLGFSGHGLTGGAGMGMAMAEFIMGNQSSPITHLIQRPYPRATAYRVLSRLLHVKACAASATRMLNWFL